MKPLRAVRLYFALSLFLALFFAPAEWTQTLVAQDGLIQAANKAASVYRDEIRRLTEWALEAGLSKEARETDLTLMPDVPDMVFIPTFSLDVGTLDLPRGLPPALPREYAEYFRSKTDRNSGNESERNEPDDEESEEGSRKPVARRDWIDRDIWQVRLRSVRINYAKRLYTLARQAAKNDRGTLAVQLAVAGLQADPDHQGFRTVFGFTKYKGQWRTPWEMDRLKKGFVDHETFGWIPRKAVDRYEKGERYCNGKWVDLDRAAAWHGRGIETGWKIESEHYDLVTNHSLEEGVRLVRMIEDCYRAWKLLFFRYMATDAQLAMLFEGRSTTIPQRRHRVFLYRDKEDFVRHLQSNSSGDVSMYAGFYIHGGDTGACHFYAVEPNAPDWQRRNVVRTMFHEATHQLFVESRKHAANYGKDYNYWLVEGVAEYMETLRRDESGYYVLGSNRSALTGNMRRGKINLLPFSELCQVNGKTFKAHHVRGESLYAQSGAAFHFLFNHEGGRWRDALTVYLRSVYDGKDDHGTLPKLTGRSFDELDAFFNDWYEGR